jgi:hypothetical protein
MAEPHHRPLLGARILDITEAANHSWVQIDLTGGFTLRVEGDDLFTVMDWRAPASGDNE